MVASILQAHGRKAGTMVTVIKALQISVGMLSQNCASAGGASIYQASGPSARLGLCLDMPLLQFEEHAPRSTAVQEDCDGLVTKRLNILPNALRRGEARSLEEPRSLRWRHAV